MEFEQCASFQPVSSPRMLREHYWRRPELLAQPDPEFGSGGRVGGRTRGGIFLGLQDYMGPRFASQFFLADTVIATLIQKSDAWYCLHINGLVGLTTRQDILEPIAIPLRGCSPSGVLYRKVHRNCL